MKNRPTRIARTADRRRRSFAFHPLSFAICLGFCGAGLAAPQGGTVVAGQATITQQTSTSQVVNQTTSKAIIDWKSFSIASGEKVRFSQPSNTSVTLNRVTGYDPSYILGEMSSNGKIFLVNPYGVVFGANARVDVGGLVASSLSIANSDFLAGRYNLTSVEPGAPAQRGEVRNEGTISAPGGMVALAGPSVSNTGTIVANGGRVGMAAVNAVSVDVEGDGLLFFQTSATEAKNRLEQLGRIQADGGSIEMRAAARGAFADTVLNMTGIVQARTIGTREGRIVIDGGAEGIVAVSGRVDATGLAADERGGSVTVEGQRVLLDNGSLVDASGSAGGGSIRVGGDFHGANPEIRNAEATVVTQGAVLRADATDAGHGGTVAIWSDGLTRYQGSTSARGGERGGDGGFVEVSGKQSLVYDGDVDTRAPKGATGTLLLDPTDITINDGPADSTTLSFVGGVFTDPTTSPSNIQAATLVTQLNFSAVIVDTTSALPGAGTITILSPVVWGTANSLTFKAKSDLTLDAVAQLRNTSSGSLNLQAEGAVVLNGPVLLGTGNLFVSDFAGSVAGATGAASFTTGAGGTITTAGGNVTIRTMGDVSLGAAVVTSGTGGATPTNAGSVTITAADGSISTGGITANGGVGTSTGGGAIGGKGGDISITVNGSLHTLNTGLISTLGGKGSDNSTNNSDGRTGGAGGAVTLANLTGGASTVGAITASGGDAGTGGNGNSDGGDGGAGGTISVTSNGGALTVANLTTMGGAETPRHGGGGNQDGTPGAGGAVALTFAQTAPGTLDVSASTITAGSASATGVPANATLVLIDGAENLTLASALLTRPTSGNLTLSGITTASVTTGTGTFNASGFAGNVGIQFTAGSGQITGNGANTTLTGLAGGSAFVVNAANGGGTIGGTTIVGIGNLAGGAGGDSFTVSGNGTLAGSITGGGGADTLTVTTTTANFVLASATSGTVSNVGGSYSGIASLTGNGTTSTLTGTSTGSTFNVATPGAGDVNATTTFTGMASLAGGTGADSFVFTGTGALVGGVNGGTGAVNTLDLSTLATANFTLTSSATTGTANRLGAAGFSNVGSLVGNDTTSTLTGRDVASTWTITGSNAGNVNDGSGTTNFTGVTSLVGGSAADAFVLGAGFSVASIDGGGGSNALTATAQATEDITLGNALLNRSVASDVTLASIGTATLVGGTGDNVLNGAAFTGNLTLQISGGTDTLTGNGSNTTVLAAAGGSSLTVNGSGSGTIGGGGTFSGVTAASGSAGSDTFIFTAAGSLSGALTGVGGNDTLDVSGIAGTLTINQSGTITGVPVGSISGITTFISNGANTSFQGNNSAQTYTITNPDAFTVASQNYTGIGSIKGGTAGDTFQFQAAGTLSGTLDGGGGGGIDILDLSARATANFTLASATAGIASGITGGYVNIATLVGNGTTSSLTGTSTGSTYAITGGGFGTVNDGVGTTNFSGIASLVGGTGADQFQVANAGTLAGSINGGGGAGVNTLDLSSRTIASADFGLVSASAGSASGITGGYTNIATLQGNGSTSLLTGTDTGSNYAVTSPGSGTVNDGVGTTNFSGIASLAGGTGADNFALSLTGTLAGSVNGGGGAGVNTLDLSGKAGADFVLSSASSGSASNLGGGYSNVTTLVGNPVSTTLTGSGTGSIFTITNNGIGTVNDGIGTTTFLNVFSLAGGTGADSFRFTGVGALAGSLDGGTGAANTLDISLTAGAATFTLAAADAGTATPITSGWSNIGNLIGNGTTSTLTGRDLSTTWAVTGNNAGTVTDSTGSIAFTSTARLVGGSAADAFVVGPGFALASIDGSGGSNSLAATAAAGENLTVVDALLTRSASTPITLVGIGSATITGEAGNNTIVGSGFSGTLSLRVTDGSDSLTGNGLNTTVVARAGGDTVNVTALNQGNANGGLTTFTQVGNLRGNTGADTFAFAGAGLLLGGNVTGVNGNDTLDLSARVGAITISQSGTTTGSGVGGTVTGVTSFIGNGAGTTFLGGNLTQTYTVTGPDLFSVAGQNLINVGAIQAGNLNDTFVVNALGSLSGALDGGPGSNTLNLAALGTANFALTSGTAGTASSIAGGYLNIATLVGNGVTSSLTSTNTGSTYDVAGPNSGTVNDGVTTTNFSGVANLTGGTGADVFRVGNTGLLTGTIAGGGGAGVNTLDLSSRATADFGLVSASSGVATGITGGYSAITTLVGNGSSTLTGTSNASTFAVGGNGSGTVTDLTGTTTFSSVGSLAGGISGDVFVISNGGSLTGSIDGGGGAGVNVLNLSGRTTADFGLASSSSGTVSGVTGGYSNVTSLTGNGSTSTLTGTNTGSTYAVTASGAGTVFDGIGSTSFSSIASLVGGTGADAFILSGSGSLAGSVNGGTGSSNSLTLVTATANFGLTSASSGIASNIGAGYSNVTSLIGNGVSSTVTGTNVASTWSVTGSNAGTVNDGSGTTAFAAVPNLVGGTAADSFTVGAGIAIGSIDGGSGAANTLAAVALTSENLTLDNAQLVRSGSSTIALANVGAATLTGGSGNNVITASGWTGGRTLTVQTTTGNDTVTGNGVDTTLVGTASASAFNVTGADSGTLTDGVNTTSYGGVGNLTGGAGNDTFLIQDAGTLTGNVNGGGGTNTLDLSNKTSATIVFSSAGNSVTGVGIAGSLSNVTNLIGNSINTLLQGVNTGQTFVITATNEITVDGTQVFQGVGSLAAGTGADSISGSAPFKLSGNVSDAGGATTLSGTIQTDGSQTYLGAVTAPSVTLVALGGLTATDPVNNFGSVTLTGGAINVRDVGAIDLLAVMVGAGQTLAINSGSAVTLHGNVTTTADQTWTGNLLFASDATLSAGTGSIAVSGNVDGGTHNLALTSANAGASAISIGGTVGNVGTFAANGNASLGGNVTSTGTQTYTGVVALTGDAVLDAGTGKVDLQRAVDGGGHNLTLTSGNAAADAVHLGNTVANTAQLTVNGPSTLGGNVSSSGNQRYNGPVTLTGDVALDAGAARVDVQGNVDGGTHNFSLSSSASAANAITLNGSVANVSGFAASGNAILGGNVTSTGNQTYTGQVGLTTDATLNAGTGKIDLQSAVDAAGHALGLTSSHAAADAVRVGAAIANASQLTVTGNSTLTTGIATTGAQTYAGSATLLADITLTGPSVSFGSTVDGAHALTINATATTFAGAVGGSTPLTSLTTNAAGTTQLGSNVTTSGSQTYNDALLLNGNAVLTGSTLNLAGSVDGARILAVNGSTGVTLGGPIGAGTALAGLSVAGPLQLSAGSIITTGAQSYAGATTLGAATTLNAPSIAFGNTLDGGFALTTQSAGTTSFAGAIGATTPLASLTANGGGAVQLSSPSVDTTGAQSYSGALQLTGSSRLTGSALTLNGPVSGATDLTLQTNAFTGGSSIAGTGVLTLAPLDPTLSIGVAGGAGTLQVSQAALDGATGFSGHVIGRTDGSGTITAGNLVLRANTTLQTATGDLNVGSVDGAFALALNSGGTTRITGPIGATTPLTSLTSDNNATATDWDGTTGERTTFDTADGTGAARVITSGAQTYNDPVTASVPVSFSGGAITATQPTNRFDGVVSATAISLDLHNSADLTLGTLTLVNGGSLETDGVLHIAGAVQLNGGVLSLTSNATPTPIDLTDPEYAGTTLSFGFVPIKEASPGIVQDTGGSIGTAAGSMLVLRAPAGGSILLEQPGNNLLGQVSAVTGTLGDNDISRFNNATGELMLGFLRIVSSEIHVAGRPPANGDQTLQQAGLEGDVIKLTADIVTTGPDGLLRARLPFNNIQGSQTSMPALTLSMSPTALANGGGFGGPDSDTFIQVQVGGSEGGFLTARPKGTSGDTAVIFLGGDSSVTPFYDGSGKLTEIRIFYNGDAPRTPQEAGALAAVIALIEDARQARFEEAVRTENVRSRLRSGVIAEVGAGRPATVGRESIRLPDTCEIKPKTLQCE